jgi:hypothetical protein
VVDFKDRQKSVVFVPPSYPSVPKADGFAAYKVSERWATGLRSACRWRIVPYIDRLGQIHSTAISRWRCTGTQLMATIVSTVFKRLQGRYRHYIFKLRPKPNDLFKIAMIYTLTNDDYWFRRTLEILNRSRDVGKHLYRKLMQLDANTKVLYDQACKNALWFQSRIRKPNHVKCPQIFDLACHERKHLAHKGLSSFVSDYSVNLSLKLWADVYTPVTSESAITTNRR